MRKKISETNLFPQFDLYAEYEKLENLVSKEKIIRGFNIVDQTLEEYVQEACFNDWWLRGTFLSINEMRNGLGINKNEFCKKNIITDKVLDFIQYSANLSIFMDYTIKKHLNAYIYYNNYMNVIFENMKSLLEQLGAKFNFDKEGKEISVIYNDDLSVVVASDNQDISDSITEYKKIDSRGDLKRKGEILCTLFKKLEAYEKKFKGTGYEKLCNDTTFLLNKIGARHCMENDKISSTTFLKMQNDELEKWYDRAYTMFLSCMVISQYLDFKNEIDSIKKV